MQVVDAMAATSAHHGAAPYSACLRAAFTHRIDLTDQLLADIISVSGSLAQSVEQKTFNLLVAGSNPARPTPDLSSPQVYLRTPADVHSLRSWRLKQGESVH